MTYLIDNPPSVLDLGRQRESLVTPVSFDCSAWLAEYPGGVLSALFRPPGALGAWLCASTQDEGIIRIPVTEALTWETGWGGLQILLQAGDDIKKRSAVMKTWAEPSLVAADGEAPSIVQGWVDQAGAELARLQGLFFEIVDGDLIVRM